MNIRITKNQLRILRWVAVCGQVTTCVLPGGRMPNLPEAPWRPHYSPERVPPRRYSHREIQALTVAGLLRTVTRAFGGLCREWVVTDAGRKYLDERKDNSTEYPT